MEQSFTHLLLVDDEDDHHFITKLTLRKAGYQGTFTGVYSADEAMQELRNGKRPDVLMVDINMPGTTGFEMLEQCESEGLLPNGHTHVVMCSSSNRAMDIETARRFQSVNDYIEKAFTQEQLDHLNNSLARRRA